MRKRVISSSTSADGKPRTNTARLDDSDLFTRLAYLEVSLHEFASIEDSLQKLVAPNFDHESAPAVRMKITIDKGEIRPEDIDDWNS